LPTWFKALVINASDGGKNSYFEVGYHTCIHLGNLINGDNQDKAIEEFNETDDIKAWCSKWIPQIMRFIPLERREIFFEGMEKCIEKDCPF
jgi:hypothetical protein